MPQVKCPQCGKIAEYKGNEFRPFCSERCKLFDFGAWADEEYALPTENAEMTEEDLREIEKELEKKQIEEGF
ncbi:MAG: DNA gyrase inhibitor YacG [Pyrinomonadaceae bacterium]